MPKDVYDRVVQLQDLVSKQGNILADVIEELNNLALIYEQAAKEATNEDNR